MAEGGEPAAKDTLSNSRDITKCCKCQYPLQDPRTLSCLHSFCNQCLGTIDKRHEDGEDGFECPQCQCFTPEKGVRVVPFLVDILEEASAKSKKRSSDKRRKCEKCGSIEAKWYCTECKKKNWFCDGCKEDHDDFVDHKVITSDEWKNEDMLFSKPVYCTKHGHNEIEYYCLQCKDTVCIKCKVEDHDRHESDRVCSLLEKQVLPHINVSIGRIKESIGENRKMAKAVEKEKEAAIVEYNRRIREFENAACEQSETLAWVKAAMDKTTGVRLFSYFHDGILERVNKLSLAGDDQMFASRCLPWKPKQNDIELIHSVPLPEKGDYNCFTRIAILWNTIWMFKHSTGYVHQYDTNGVKLTEIKLHPSINSPRTAVSLNSNMAILAAKSGLFTINRKGELIKSITLGNISDLCFVREMVYALEYELGKVLTFFIKPQDVNKKNEIALENYSKENKYLNRNYANTHIVNGNNIYVCMLNRGIIVNYDKSGKRIRVIAQNGLKNPSLCGFFKDWLLVANCNGNSVEWRSLAGETEVVIEQEAFCPWFATFGSNTKLWVIDDFGPTLRLFSIKYNEK